MITVTEIQIRNINYLQIQVNLANLLVIIRLILTLLIMSKTFFEHLKIIMLKKNVWNGCLNNGRRIKNNYRSRNANHRRFV